MNTHKVALAIICAPIDREAQLLDRCLGGIKRADQVQQENKNIDSRGTDGIAKHVDAIFITITGENESVKRVAEKYGAHVSNCEWHDDYAEARNFNFSQVPKEYEYIVWCDTDDVIRNPQAIKPLIEKMSNDAMDALTLRYLYDHDEEGNCIKEHLKTRIVKNDGCVEWAAAVHEDFKMKREINGFFNDEIQYVHFSDPKRRLESTARNLRIAELEVKRNPSDPRTYWNLANSYISTGRYKEAIDIYSQFITISDSEEEKFMVYQMLAVCYVALSQWDNAIIMGSMALNFRPWYPDAYILLGELNYHIGKLRAAREYLEMGITKKLPEFESIVWNPMDYKYKPHMLLAQTYAMMNMHRKSLEQWKICLKERPKATFIKNVISELEKELYKSDLAEEIYKKANKSKNIEEVRSLLNKVSKDMRYYPPIVSLRHEYFVKTESSGKDVAIFCSFTSGEWNPIVFREKGVGGSEEAIVQLAKRFAKSGYNVTVFCSTPKMQEYFEDGVWWKPWMDWNYRDKYDITILWRHPKMLDFPINSEKIYMDVHDVISPEEFTEARLLKLTKVLFKSKTQRDYYKNIPDNKCVVIPHGLDIIDFDAQRDEIKKNPYYILNTSSPDRSLVTFCKIIKSIYDKLPKELKPKLKADSFYGFDIWDHEFADDEKMLSWRDKAMDKIKELQKLGIMSSRSGTRVSQTEVTKKYLEAGVVLYPSEFAEIGYIGGIKGMLAGCIPATTTAFAQGEFAKDGIIVKSDVDYSNWRRDLSNGTDFGVQKESQINEFIDRLVEYLKEPEKYNKMRSQLVDYARSCFDWDKTAQLWISEFNE